MSIDYLKTLSRQALGELADQTSPAWYAAVCESEMPEDQFLAELADQLGDEKIRSLRSASLREKDVSTGMVVNFRHPEDTRVDVHYNRCRLIDGEWQEGNQRRTVSITINNQCDFAQAVMDVKRAADSLGIDFGDSPTIIVEIPSDSPLVNGYHLCATAARQLGWDMTCPERIVPTPTVFTLDPDDSDESFGSDVPKVG